MIALAVSDGRLDAAAAFTAAQTDELYQVDRWGDDPIAEKQREGVRRDIEAAARFLSLLRTRVCAAEGNHGSGPRLRKAMEEKGLVEAMAGHSPLSAMLAAEGGLRRDLGSGFELSALYGVPDVSIVSMTQHLDMTRAMADRSGLPVVADIDNRLRATPSTSSMRWSSTSGPASVRS